MNEYVLYPFAQVATTLAGFSGLVVVFRVRGTQAWSATELRTFWFLLGDTFLVLFFSLLPVPLSLATARPGPMTRGKGSPRLWLRTLSGQEKLVEQFRDCI
jgi:hypothetical protein